MDQRSHLLEQGAYGCVFTSKLHCKAGTKVALGASIGKGPKVNKLLDTDNAEKEIEIAKRILAIPYYKHYFIVAESICKPDPVRVEKEMGLEECEVLERYDIPEVRILSMPHGGVDLKQYQPNVDRFRLTSFFAKLLQAGALLNLHGIVHHDLHEANIVMDDHDNPRMIDFNLSVNIQQGVTHDGLFLKENSLWYVQYSPDFSLVNAIAQQKEMHEAVEEIIGKKRGLTHISSLLNYPRSAMKEDLIAFYAESQAAKKGDLKEWFDFHWHTIDAWAIAYLVVQRWKHISVFPSFMAVLDTDKDKDKMQRLLKRMMALNPFDRLDCVQALFEWDPSHYILRLPKAVAWMKRAVEDRAERPMKQ